MKPVIAFVIFASVLIISSIVLYHMFMSARIYEESKRLNKICSAMTDNINSKVDENSSYTSCYCYYEPYAPPPNMEKTRTLCVCDCKLKEGGMTKIQVLTPT